MGSSTPSAMACSPMAKARLMIEATIALSSDSRPRPSTKLRSILMTSTGRSRSRASEEKPVPKSSAARYTPSERRRSNVSTGGPALCIRELSVSSRHTAEGSIPLTASASRTSLTSPGSASCSGERLIVTAPGAPSRRDFQSASWRHAS